MFCPNLAAADWAPFSLPEQSPVNFAPEPKAAQDALDTLSARRLAVLRYMACSNEEGFLEGNNKLDTGEDSLTRILAKAAWLVRNQQEEACVNTHQLNEVEKNLPGRFKAAFPGGPCDNAFTYASTGTDFQITTTISRQCMRLEINTYLGAMVKDKQVGSSGLPCIGWQLFGNGLSTKGEWDVTVRDLTRIRYLDRLNPNIFGITGLNLLDTTVEAHVDKLLDISGALGQDTYNLMGCGDTEDTTGDPSSDADINWVTQIAGPVKKISDFIFQDLLRWLLILLVLAGLVGLVTILLGPAAAAVIAGIVLAAGLVAESLHIPETENHRLMIETSRYLKNQAFIADDMSNGVQVNDLQNFQTGIKTWLLGRTHGFIDHDFQEYNGRPYQRYSMIALMNLFDFANDADLVTAGQISIDYAYTKFAVGSNGGRRLVPFRRRIDAIDERVRIPDLKPDDLVDASLFGESETGDYMIAANSLYTGQTSELQSFFLFSDAAGTHSACQLSPCISNSIAATALAAADSKYAPDLSSLDIAMSDNLTAMQTIRHAGLEIYSRGPGYLITAGGVRAPRTSEVLLTCPPLITWCGSGGLGIGSLTWLFAGHTDEGFGVPTTLMLSGSPSNTDIDKPGGYRDFIFATGSLIEFSSDAATFDRNVCVWGGFACGTNIGVPTDLSKVSKPALPSDCARNVGAWTFIDTGLPSCPGSEKRSHRFYITVYRLCTSSTSSDCQSNVGFFYILPARPTENIDHFAKRVVNANSAVDVANASSGVGTFHSPDGHVIQYRTAADGISQPQIASVDGTPSASFSDFPIAKGDVINGSAARVWINDRHLYRSLELDFTDLNHPKRYVITPQ